MCTSIRMWWMWYITKSEISCRLNLSFDSCLVICVYLSQSLAFSIPMLKRQFKLRLELELDCWFMVTRTLVLCTSTTLWNVLYAWCHFTVEPFLLLGIQLFHLLKADFFEGIPLLRRHWKINPDETNIVQKYLNCTIPSNFDVQCTDP